MKEIQFNKELLLPLMEPLLYGTKMLGQLWANRLLIRIFPYGIFMRSLGVEAGVLLTDDIVGVGGLFKDAPVMEGAVDGSFFSQVLNSLADDVPVTLKWSSDRLSFIQNKYRSSTELFPAEEYPEMKVRTAEETILLDVPSFESLVKLAAPFGTSNPGVHVKFYYKPKHGVDAMVVTASDGKRLAFYEWFTDQFYRENAEGGDNDHRQESRFSSDQLVQFLKLFGGIKGEKVRVHFCGEGDLIFEHIQGRILRRQIMKTNDWKFPELPSVFEQAKNCEFTRLVKEWARLGAMMRRAFTVCDLEIPVAHLKFFQDRVVVEAASGNRGHYTEPMELEGDGKVSLMVNPKFVLDVVTSVRTSLRDDTEGKGQLTIGGYTYHNPLCFHLTGMKNFRALWVVMPMRRDSAIRTGKGE